MEKFDELTNELKILAKRIIDDEQGMDMESGLELARELYEKLLVLNHLENQRESADSSVQNVEEANTFVTEQITEETVEIEITQEIPNDVEEPAAEEDAPLSLNDLFVPTFDDIKEDMSQKEEFKDTISLDETEKLFQTKKEEPRQLSLNDRLVGSSIQVGLNDRIAFVNKLFNFSQSDFNKVLSRLNECKTRDEALNYFQYQVKPNYNWKGKEDLEERLVSLIERKYM